MRVKSLMSVRLLVLTALLLWGCAAPSGVYHTVKKGETLYRISRTYEVDERYLARINGINDPTRIEIGQLIYIPGATVPRQITPTKAASRPSTPPPAATSAQKSASRPAAAPPKTPATIPPPSQNVQIAVPKAEKGRFDWPVKGRVLRNFSPSGPQACKGIEIAVSAGTPVLSAAAGKVTYSGDGIRGYGNLIILRHDDSFFTVYGFNNRILVDQGAYVGKGDKIALSGTPPGGGDPRLHFEIRHGKTAVNPIFYLP